MGLAADIYADQLSYLRYGHPMWRPEPKAREGPMIGDFGHLADGQFRRLFCCARPKNHELNDTGRPKDFSQLTFDRKLVVAKERVIESGTLQGKNVTVKSISSAVDKKTRPLMSVDFSCSSEQGAILVMPYYASSRAVRPNREFIEYFKRNKASWYDTAVNNWSLDVQPEDLILIRGWIKTTEFSLAAIAQKRYAYWFFPDREIDTFREMAGMKFQPNSAQIIQYRTGPHRRTPYPFIKYSESDPDHGVDPNNPNPTPFEPVTIVAEAANPPTSPEVDEVMEQASVTDEDEDDDEVVSDEGGSTGVDSFDFEAYNTVAINAYRDQTIFLNYYKLRRRMFLPEKIVANGESEGRPPSPPPDGKSGSPLKVRSDSWTPLDELLVYLLRHSNADVAIACDDDVFMLCEGHGWPDDFEEFYETLLPRIYVDDDNVAVVYRKEYLPDSSSSTSLAASHPTTFNTSHPTNIDSFRPSQPIHQRIHSPLNAQTFYSLQTKLHFPITFLLPSIYPDTDNLSNPASLDPTIRTSGALLLVN
ncbi:hypothetical protein ABKN59_009889 [Abortiporus biennis]